MSKVKKTGLSSSNPLYVEKGTHAAFSKKGSASTMGKQQQLAFPRLGTKLRTSVRGLTRTLNRKRGLSASKTDLNNAQHYAREHSQSNYSKSTEVIVEEDVLLVDEIYEQENGLYHLESCEKVGKLAVSEHMHEILTKCDIGNINFPIDNLTVSELESIGAFMFWITTPEFDTFDHFLSLLDFVQQVQQSYSNNAYHSFKHVFDVMQMMFVLITETDAATWLIHSYEPFQLLCACLCHDMGHNGTTNAHLRKVEHKWVKTYGRTSTMEKFHAKWMRDILETHALMDVFEIGVKNTILNEISLMILQTDMEVNNKVVAHFEQQIKSDREMKTDTCRTAFYAICIKVCDISNVARPFPIAKSWSYKLEDEQKPIHGRETPDHKKVAQATKSFITNIVLPMADVFALACPLAADMLKNNMETNIIQWTNLEMTYNNVNAA